MPSVLRVLIADDSVLYRTVIARSLESLGNVEIVGSAATGREALERIRNLSPDLVTLDLTMPELDGLGVLRQLKLEKHPCEVIMISASTRQGAESTLEALRLGAVDFIAKPAEGGPQGSAEELTDQLKRKLAVVRLRKQSSVGKVTGSVISVPPERHLPGSLRGRGVADRSPEIIAIGTSTGGPQALEQVICRLPAELPVPVVIVQHMPATFTASLAETLNRKSSIRVVHAHEGQKLVAGTVFLAPGGKQMKLKRTFDGNVRIALTDDPPERHCRPSVDYLFRSVAEVYLGRALGIIMTGMGDDGVAGLRDMKARGATVLAQDEASSTVFGMPKEAIRAGLVDAVVPLDRIAPEILQALNSHGQH